MGTQYVHLDLDERRQVARWRDAKMSVVEIALRLGRAPSTIYREIRRNFFRDADLPKLNGYYGLNAQAIAERRRQVTRKLVRFPQVKAVVLDSLKGGWSPEQIAGRMELEQHPVFAGLFVPGWTSVRKLKDGETTDDLFAFMTTEPNAEVAKVYPKAMPVILTDPADWTAWLAAPWSEAYRLQKKLPNGLLQRVLV